jgi:tetratricopeptide (TPR) repeat protein
VLRSSRVRRAAAATFACFVGVSTLATADTITLTNGNVIEADRAWYEGTQLRYEKNGGVYGLPRTLVKALVQGAPTAASSDPDVGRGREQLASRNPTEATRAFRAALGRDPSSLPALQGLSEATLALGDPQGAREAAERALKIDLRNPRSRVLLADALAAMGDLAGAQEHYRRSLQLRPDPEVERRLAAIVPKAAAPRPRFVVRYDGGLDEALGARVLKVLDAAYVEYTRRLAFQPDQPITVVLEMGSGLADPRVPEWAAGVNDGSIRVPVRGAEPSNERLTAVMRHELAHSFLAARTGGNCPTWLQEGVSQWLEGGDPARSDREAATAAREGRLLPLITLEAPFQTLPPESIPLAYAESLSAIAHILRRKGEAGVVRLLAGLGDRLPSEEALPVALALSYPEFQRSWEDYLRGVR